jgi:hypothetical protein
MIFKNLFIFLIVFLISVKSMPNDKFLTYLVDNPLISEKNINDNPLFNVRCFWINGLNLYDISGLQRTNQK